MSTGGSGGDVIARATIPIEADTSEFDRAFASLSNSAQVTIRQTMAKIRDQMARAQLKIKEIEGLGATPANLAKIKKLTDAYQAMGARMQAVEERATARAIDAADRRAVAAERAANRRAMADRKAAEESARAAARGASAAARAGESRCCAARGRSCRSPTATRSSRARATCRTRRPPRPTARASPPSTSRAPPDAG